MTVPLQQYRHLLVRYLRPQWPRVALLGLLLCGTIAMELVNPLIVRSFIDTAQAGGSEHALIVTALLFTCVALATQIVSVLDTYVAENVGWTATNRLRRDLALHCLRLDLSFHNTHTPGEMIERIDGDVTTLGSFFSRLVIHVLGNALLFIGVLVLLYRIDLRVGLAVTGFAVISLILTNRLRNLAVPHWAAARQASAELFGFLEEHLAGTEDIRASGATAYTMQRSFGLARTLLQRERRARVTNNAVGSATLLMLALGTALSLGLGAYLYRSGAITLGSVYLIFNYTEMLRRPITQVTRQLQELQQAAAGIGRIQSLLDTQSVIVEVPAPATVTAGPLSVVFQNVSFAYEAAEPVLQEICFALQPGAVLGVLGRTGSGKTTLTRLLFRLYDPSEGAIQLGGVDLREMALADLRARLGMVTQDIQIFHASVRDNLTFFDPAIPDGLIVQTLAELGLWEWYRSLPDGLDTRLATGGGLSAGEAQLLAFARVFLRDPGVVILDEASSRLDPATERRTEQAVDRLLAGRTGIVIAHRLATVNRADQILIVEDGRVREYGSRAALARDPHSHFSHLLQMGMEEALA